LSYLSPGPESNLLQTTDLIHAHMEVHQLEPIILAVLCEYSLLALEFSFVTQLGNGG